MIVFPYLLYYFYLMAEIPQNNLNTKEKNILSIAEKTLQDNKLSFIERIEINKLIAEYNLEKKDVAQNTREQIQQIKNELELKNLLKTRFYQDIFKEAQILSPNKIKNIQYILWTKITWKFWIFTILAYKNSPLSRLFSITELSKWRKVWPNIKNFIEKFKKLSWVDSEILAIILSSNISPDTFVNLDKNWNITLSKNGQHIITFSEKESLESLLHNSFVKKDLNMIVKQLQLISSPEDKKDYVNTLKSIIKNYNYYEEARTIFTKKIWDEIIINLPETSLNKYMGVKDLFWDFDKLIVWDDTFTKDNQWNFISQKTGKILLIHNQMRIILEVKKVDKKEKEKKDLPTKNAWEEWKKQVQETNEWNLRKELWDWLAKDGKKFLNPERTNSCWPWFDNLLDKFFQKKYGIKNWLKLEIQRNGANFDNIFDWLVSDINKFILFGNIKISSKEDLLRIGKIKMDNFLDKRLIIKVRDIDFPKDAFPWEIVVFNEDALIWSKARKNYWHVEIKWSDGQYHSYYDSYKPWWSSHASENWDPWLYKKLTWFNGKAYSIELA